MANCACGGHLVRIHRTLGQKFLYMAVYRCRICSRTTERPRRFMFYFADETRCPVCGTQKLKRLSVPDHIDPFHWNLFRLVHSMVNTRLYHCRYCRIQFYDLPRGKARHHAEAV